jgi:two-component system response regulator MprA
MAPIVPSRPDFLLNARSAPIGTAAILSVVLVAQLLIVEDDAGLRDVLVRTFRAEGFGARGVATGADTLAHIVAHGAPDALVIDIGLPDADGRDLCQAIRARGVLAPVLFLTARHALTDRLSGFRAGGDDYVTKPFDIEEIVARLRALLRRTAAEAGEVPALGLTLDPAEHTVSRGGTTRSLTPTEFRLLAALAGRPGKALARVELTGAAWPHGAIVQDNTLDVYIARIRRKLGALPDGPTIVTQHGVGYRLVLEERE